MKKLASHGLIGQHKHMIHVSVNEKGSEVPGREFQVRTTGVRGPGYMMGGKYVGKGKIHGYEVHTPGNIHARMNLIDKTSKEIQVGRILRQGTA